MTLIVNASTVYGQHTTECSIDDSCGVVYSHEMDKRALITYSENERRKTIIIQKDSLIASKDRLLNIKDSINFHLERSVTILESSLDNKNNLVTSLSKDLGKCRRNRNITLSIGIGSAFLVGAFVGTKIK